MCEVPTVKITCGTEVLFESTGPPHSCAADSKKEHTAALVLALDYIQSQTNNFLTDLIAKEGQPSEVESDHEPCESESEDDGHLDISKGHKRSSSATQM